MLLWLCDVSNRWGIRYDEEEVENACGVFRKCEEAWRVEDEGQGLGQGLGGVGGVDVEGEGGNSVSSSSFPLSNATPSSSPPSSTAAAVLLSDWSEAYLDPFTFSDR